MNDFGLEYTADELKLSLCDLKPEKRCCVLVADLLQLPPALQKSALNKIFSPRQTVLVLCKRVVNAVYSM